MSSETKRPRKKIRYYMPIDDYQISVMLAKSKTYDFQAVKKDDDKDLLVFAGGPDVNPALYGENRNPTSSISQRRDEIDIEAFESHKDHPKVGICRGGQFLNVKSGGAMFQHVDNHGRDHLVYNLLDLPGVEKAVRCTSTHHQMMIPSNKGTVIGLARDSDITHRKGLSNTYVTEKVGGRPKPIFDTEVIWYRETNSLCFQPHPENLLEPCQNYFFALLEHFFDDQFVYEHKKRVEEDQKIG